MHDNLHPVFRDIADSIAGPAARQAPNAVGTHAAHSLAPDLQALLGAAADAQALAAAPRTHCIDCGKPFSDLNVFTEAGERETQISGMCEACFDEAFEDADEADEDDEDDLCPDCAGSGEGTYDGAKCATCHGCGEVGQPIRHETDEEWEASYRLSNGGAF